MGWMKAIYTDVQELSESLCTGLDTDEVWEEVDASGWISPTVSDLARTLIKEVMERTPHDEEDIKQMERVVGLLSPGERVVVPTGNGVDMALYGTGE